ncbi:Uncharacterised protein [Mycobacteroides abscessus subsp. abscessus]|nr:Uncharacterised protein [Mycobacteroides abscessus subsp. abscessus]
MRACGGHEDCQEGLYRTVFRRIPRIKLGGPRTQCRTGVDTPPQILFYANVCINREDAPWLWQHSPCTWSSSPQDSAGRATGSGARPDPPASEDSTVALAHASGWQGWDSARQ